MTLSSKKSHSVKVTTTVTTPGVDNVADFEKPLVSLSVSNPFKKILYWLDQIRRKQTTTFAVKLSIPLIAIPIIFAAAFSLGRVNGIDFVRNLPTNKSGGTVATASPSPAAGIEISKAGILKVAKSEFRTSYLLTLSNGAIVILDIPQTINLTKYANKQILVTGIYNKSTNVLRVSDIAEVTIYNTTVIPGSTESAVPSQ